MARASLQELLLDYEDYLRVRGLELWDLSDPRSVQSRNACRAHNESAYYRERLAARSDETIANIAVTLIHQTDILLRKLIENAKEEFLREGGIREQMTRARINYRNNNPQ